ncbi:hypothetical protein AGABI1DRAFT_80141 [Agaricus bisporus var. burnettii JB137-S8]|uniref:Adenylate cyclase n=1 Tax=Agaricus bisporus var. burnettii (strain JB137-S8 / ATCC MYA-4627 / FGSC 10392) TaxID=597362 RepID=K5XL67_AGABU|nr:uncharacterized protein AGABI1DRAFT_80141 [Agaricus bisporus var. burnettii JB137-S8]EKM75265.1 hypothetical protein AGABI1DRAFT_80141 [Agaricus bisporus var. burnettii JB137-S8]
MKIYRPNGAPIQTAMGISLTVYDLIPTLLKRMVGDERRLNRLFLMERGKERIMDIRELPLNLICRRMTEAGYSWNDGRILLSGDRLAFLLKFIFRDPDMGLGRRSLTADAPYQIPESELRLHNFETLDLSGRSLRTIPVALHQHADQIISLKLSRNPMIDLPLDFVEACTSLCDLRLSNMSMRKIPANLVAAKALKRLDLSSNHIKIKELENANLQLIPELRGLLLHNNLLKDLPQKFADFENLLNLNISSNRLPTIPDVVLQIKTLTELDVSFNYITDLPTNVGDMTSLQRFLFVGNSIKSIPNSFWKLRNLEHVDCRRNQIGDLGIVMNLPRLETLNADHNAIHLLDLSMGKHVMKIDLSNNEITKVMVSLPPFGSTSLQLTTLDVSYASLTTLDGAVLRNLPTLVTLRIQHNSLAYLPDSIEELVHLETLICYENRLQRLPDTIGKLSKLITLDAHSNNLREVPVAIWQCPSLCILNLSSNFLTTFPVPPLIPLYPMPDQTGRIADPPKNYDASHVISSILYPPLMFSLENLSISENKISSIDSLRNISFFRSLLSLNLSYNDISDLPKGFFRKMYRLEEFHICGNDLTMIPGHEEFSNLRELRRLFLSGNKLTSLPAELGRLKRLKVMDVSNNCLRYNINNYGYDWNWNNNEDLYYLNLSGNKRFQVKRDNRHTFGSSRSSRELHNPLSGFSSVPKLRILGLMDVTVTASDLPDEHEDRRVRSTSSLVGGLGYGIADSLNIDDSMTMLDLVHEFPPINGTSRALFAMFGNAKPPKLPIGVSPNKHAKFLHDHFIPFFQNQLDHPYLQESNHFAVDVLRRSFLGLHQTIHDMWFPPVQRKASMASVAGGLPTVNVDSGTARTGCSGLVVYIEGNRLFAANVGSAHGVISRKGQPFLVTRIHCPWDEDELKRMRKSEGWVSPEGLVNNEVDVSRSFGYYQLLPVVNASPDIVEYEISETDEYLVLGNRALWDFVSYQTAVDIASGRGEPSMIAQKLRDFAISYGSTGNIMVMVVRLKDYHERPLVRTPSMIESDSPFSPALYIPKSNHMVVDKSVRRAEPEVPPPTGHIALVFTDIRNSTPLWELNPGMPAAIQIHNDLMRRRLRECGGYEFKTEGDAFLCSFPTIMAAVWFCLSVQNQLLQENWPKEILECEDGKVIVDSEGNVLWKGISVRMGIHSGTPVCLQDPVTHRMDYYGPVINRAARVSGLAKGGQIFCSAEVVQEIKASVLEAIEKTSLSKSQPAKAIAEVKQLGVIIKEVGEMKLKGLEVPEFISAIYTPGLEGRHDFDAEEDPAPASVYLDVAHVREIGMLCLRLEALTSGRIFKPSNTARDLNLTIPLEDDPEDEDNPELWRDLEVDPENLLPPMTTRWTDHDLLTTLDSFTCRIQNALQTLIKAYEADRINAPNIMNVLRNAGLDADTLLVMAELIGHS